MELSILETYLKKFCPFCHDRELIKVLTGIRILRPIADELPVY